MVFMIMQIPYFILPFTFQNFDHGLHICIEWIEIKKRNVRN